MAGEGGKLEEVGGNSERKARIVGSFIGVVLLALISVLLVVVGFLLIFKGRLPLRPVEEPHKESRITSSLCPAHLTAQTPVDDLTNSGATWSIMLTGRVQTEILQTHAT
jgi:hypothetical protein